MLDKLTIVIETEEISISAEDGLLLLRTSNLLALDQGGQVVGIGKSYDELPKQRDVRIFNPFLIDQFEPKQAAIVISRLVADSKRSLLSEAAEEGRTLSINCQIFIPEYENLDKAKRDAFEYYTQHLSYLKINSLTINNQLKPIEGFRRAKQALEAGLILSVFGVQGLIFMVLQITVPEQIPRHLSFFGMILYFIFFICYVYIASLMYIAICKKMMKNLIPAPVYKDMLEDLPLSPKRLLSLIQDKIASKQKGG